MKLNRFFVNCDLDKKTAKIKDAELWNQVRNVFRMKAGDSVILCDGSDGEAEARIKTIGKNEIEFELAGPKQNQNEPRKEVVLYCSILKKENFELVCQKATEAGVKRIVPVVCSHTVKLDLRYDRLNKIIKEAAEQSGRGIVPALSQAVKFEDAIVRAEKNDLFFDISGNGFKATETSGDKLSIFIGPEGGWNEAEVNLAREAGLKIVSLGKLTLRAETAATIASFLAQL